MIPVRQTQLSGDSPHLKRTIRTPPVTNEEQFERNYGLEWKELQGGFASNKRRDRRVWSTPSTFRGPQADLRLFHMPPMGMLMLTPLQPTIVLSSLASSLPATHRLPWVAGYGSRALGTLQPRRRMQRQRPPSARRFKGTTNTPQMSPVFQQTFKKTRCTCKFKSISLEHLSR